MNKLFLLNICWIINIITALMFILIFPLSLYIEGFVDLHYNFISSIFGSIFLYSLGAINFIFWVVNIFIWRNKRGNFFTLFLLLQFNLVYTVFYYPKNKKYLDISDN